MSSQTELIRRTVRENMWLSRGGQAEDCGDLQVYSPAPEVLPTEEAVGQAMLQELRACAEQKTGDVVIALLGGRGAQAMHRLLGEAAHGDRLDWLLSRLRVFTQDALAPMRMKSSLSFVRDFERLLGSDFFHKVKSFTSMRTDLLDLRAGLAHYVKKLEEAGGLDIFFLGHGPEPNDASHLAYIKPNSGATLHDLAGVIPISSSIVEHHITKFKAGGSEVSPQDEEECRQATHILTLGPAAILKARRLVQSIVDADTAPAKRATFRRVMEEKISDDGGTRARQLDENPGLWVRLHPNVRSLVLPDVF
ncbi:MAG TPA: 6-phosphogluconolactonase [Acidobacteriota bacterium]|jgi:6-phosphogluconolactonase/glucosamine-6-phosphate isomerase/deaminase